MAMILLRHAIHEFISAVTCQRFNRTKPNCISCVLDCWGDGMKKFQGHKSLSKSRIIFVHLVSEYKQVSRELFFLPPINWEKSLVASRRARESEESEERLRERVGGASHRIVTIIRPRIRDKIIYKQRINQRVKNPQEKIFEKILSHDLPNGWNIMKLCHLFSNLIILGWLCLVILRKQI